VAEAAKRDPEKFGPVVEAVDHRDQSLLAAILDLGKRQTGYWAI